MFLLLTSFCKSWLTGFYSTTLGDIRFHQQKESVVKKSIPLPTMNSDSGSELINTDPETTEIAQSKQEIDLNNFKKMYCFI